MLATLLFLPMAGLGLQRCAGNVGTVEMNLCSMPYPWIFMMLFCNFWDVLFCNFWDVLFCNFWDVPCHKPRIAATGEW